MNKEERKIRRTQRKIRREKKKEELRERWKNSKFRAWLKGYDWKGLGKKVGLLLLKKIQQRGK